MAKNMWIANRLVETPKVIDSMMKRYEDYRSNLGNIQESLIHCLQYKGIANPMMETPQIINPMINKYVDFVSHGRNT